MKLRPQINGPIDVGYGNYILTSPPDRAGRREDEADGADSSSAENNKESGGTRSARQMANGKYDVSELLALSNTLSNPNTKKTKIELWKELLENEIIEVKVDFLLKWRPT